MEPFPLQSFLFVLFRRLQKPTSGSDEKRAFVQVYTFGRCRSAILALLSLTQPQQPGQHYIHTFSIDAICADVSGAFYQFTLLLRVLLNSCCIINNNSYRVSLFVSLRYFYATTTAVTAALLAAAASTSTNTGTHIVYFGRNALKSEVVGHTQSVVRACLLCFL